jgi:hypothetical protein
MGGVVLFVVLKLSGSISNRTTILHQYSPNTHAGCIAIHIKQLLDAGLSQHRCNSEELLQSEKGFFALWAPLNLASFSKSLVIGLVILEKFGMNQR